MNYTEGLNSLMNNYDPVKQKIEESKAIVSKWSKSGLLEGINNDFEKSGMAVLLENQARQLIQESSATSTNAIGGGGAQEAWNGVALPLVRKVFGEIAAKEFVSVQPMNLPSGLIFYLDYKYSTAQPGFDSTTAIDSIAGAPSSVYGKTGVAGDPEGGLYGAGRFGYSINEVNTHLTTSAVTYAAATDGDVNFDYTASSQLKKITFTFANASATNPDLSGVRAFKVSNADFNTYYPAYTLVNTAGTQISFVVSASAATLSAGSVSMSYHKAPTDITRGDFEATSTSDVGIPEIDIQLRSYPIVAKTRKLKAVWTPEMAQDLTAYHSIDAEAELTSMLSEYVSMEIDLEILDMLIQNALTVDYWSAKSNAFWNTTTLSFDAPLAVGSGGYYNSQGGWFQTLGTKIQKVSNKIHQKTMRGGANFLVCSPAVATILEAIPGFAADTDGSKMKFAMGVQKIGALNNRFTVYKNPYMLENVILMGYKGSQFLESGAVYAPYVPLIMTPLVYDPTNFTPRKGVMTRYAKKVVRSEFYGKIIVDALETI